MLYRRIGFWVLLLLVALNGQVVARTWVVDRYGSGDFGTIHNAMNACSDGDTISILPGRYADFHPFTAPAWTSEAIVGVSKDNLTFIGSGNMSTIIGPTERYLPDGVNPKPMAIASVDTINARFVNIGFENAYVCIYWTHGRLEVEGCRFGGYNIGIASFNEEGVQLVQSDFYSEESLPTGIATFAPCRFVDIEGCTFGGPIINERGIDLNGTTDITISDCNFDTESAMVFSNSSGTIENCSTTNNVGLSVWATSASQVELVGNQIFGSFSSVYVDGQSSVNGTGNVFSGGADHATIFISGQSQVNLNGNDILKNGLFAAKIGQYFGEIVVNDLTGNFWGTADADSIAGWIWDYNDDTITNSYIDYTPFAGGSVPIEERPLGSLKSMFR